MKKVFFIILVSLVVHSCATTKRLPGADRGEAIDFRKNWQLKNDIDNIASSVAGQMMRCCSTYGGKEVSVLVIYKGVRRSSLNRYVIPMKISWVGSVTGRNYWLFGNLNVDENGGKSWQQVSDSGRMLSSRKCMINCIESNY